MPRRSVFLLFLTLTLIVALLANVPLAAQVAGPNVNMVSGTQLINGDPFLQRQNESSMAVSTRNPLHLLAGANDYRTVDIPFPPDQNQETGDAWVSVFSSIDGGQSWSSTLLPGFPQDTSSVGASSPLHQFAVATDPTVRAGTHGLFYYSGLVFARGNNAPSGVFVATFQDQNNKGNGDGAIQPTKGSAGSPFLYLNVSMVDTGTSGQFLDKPWIAVDVPRPGRTASCNINGQTIQSGYVYVFYTQFTGSTNNPSSKIKEVESSDCGKTWSHPQSLAQSSKINQGTVAAIDPSTGNVWVFWRQIGVPGQQNQPDTMWYAVSTDGGSTFANGIAYTFPTNSSFDEPVNSTTFRETDLPAVAVDGTGRVWLAFSQRGLGPYGEARILMMTRPPGLAGGAKKWSSPFLADTTLGPQDGGHQFMPALTFAYGKLMLTYFDSRDDNTVGQLVCPQGQTCTNTSQFVEVRVPVGDRALGTPAALQKVFGPTISDAGMKVRHTIDVRGAMVDPSQYNANTNSLPFPSVRISKYAFGSRPGSRTIEQMKFNPPNFPMFVHGTKPFIGDYIDVTALTMVPGPNNTWTFNTQASNAAVFHTTWTDNRDVRPPPVTCSNGVCTQNWQLYTPVGSTGGASIYDPTQSKPVCTPGSTDNQTGSRNQNVYSAAITQGLLVAFKENSKQLVNASGAPVQRSFSVFVRNTTNSLAFYRLTIGGLPLNSCSTSTLTASFLQFGCLPSLDVAVPARSTVARSVFVTLKPGTARNAGVTVNVVQITGLTGTVVAGGLTSTATTNPDITNPDITNPDITNPDITNPDITSPYTTNPDITNAEVYDPTVTNPDITNPDITNPDITNPDITNPDITNPDITNPDITNVQVTNPDITNPDITNPDITNPDITNPDITNPDITNLGDSSGISNGATDFTYKIAARGNTGQTYNAKVFAKAVGVLCGNGGYKCQLIARKTYPTPIASSCSLTVEVQNTPISSIPNPAFSTQDNAGTPDTSGDPTNATISLGPGEGARITLRVFGLPKNTPPPIPVKTVAVSAGADTGQTTPAASLTITTTELPVAVVGTNFSRLLTSVGGVGASTWSLNGGTLPQQITLAPTGLLSGPVTDLPGSYPISPKVQDSATSLINGVVTPTPNIDLQNLTVQVNKFTIQSITAATSNPNPQFINPTDTVTISVTVENDGPATASNVSLQNFLRNATAAGGGPSPAMTCSSASPAVATIGSNSTQLFLITCNNATGNGAITFTAGAKTQYLNAFNPADTVNATAAALTSNSLTVDTTPPSLTRTGLVIEGGAPYTPGAWTNKSVTVSYACSDNLSGVALGSPLISVANALGAIVTVTPGGDILHSTASATLPSDTPNGSTSAQCTDVAGNSALPPAVVSPIMIDKTLPQISAAAVSGNANYLANTWTNQPVTLTFTCSDTLSPTAANSGVTAVNFPLLTGVPGGVSVVNTQVDATHATATLTLTAETAGTTVAASCSDVATNPGSSTSFGPIKIDRTAPQTTAAALSAGNPYAANTWTNQPVSVTFTCADTFSPLSVNSGVTSPNYPIVTGQPGSASVSYLQNTPLTASTTVVLTDETAGTTLSASCADNATNPAPTLNFGPIKIDKTVPALAVAATKADASPYTAGTWTNQNITVKYTCSDVASAVANSGIASPNYPLVAGLPAGAVVTNDPLDGLHAATSVTLTAETAGTTLSASCSDIAANAAAPLQFGPVMIDKTPPAVTGTATTPGGPYVAGTWTSQPVTVSFACQDAASGPDLTSISGNTTVSTQQVVTANGSCRDLAGNTGVGSFGPIKIDTTGPAITITSPQSGQQFLLNQTITPSYTCDEGIGGIDSVQCTVTPSATPYLASAVGPATFSVNAVDDAGLPASASTNYQVVYKFVGFASPLATAGSPATPSNSGLFQQGATVQFQWQLQDFNLAAIDNNATLTSIAAYPSATCAGPAGGTPLSLYANGAPVSQSDTFALTGDVYGFAWNTTGVPLGCYIVVVTLDDGMQYATMVNIAGQPIVNIAPAANAADLISRGFYLPSYPGTTLSQATLYLSASTAGSYTVSLTAHAGTYDGAVLGASQTTVALSDTPVATSFNFPNVAVNSGSTVAFVIQLVSAPTSSSTVLYGVTSCGLGDTGCTIPGPTVTETDGTTPPLDSFRRNGVGLQLIGAP